MAWTVNAVATCPWSTVGRTRRSIPVRWRKRPGCLNPSQVRFPWDSLLANRAVKRGDTGCNKMHSSAIGAGIPPLQTEIGESDEVPAAQPTTSVRREARSYRLALPQWRGSGSSRQPARSALRGNRVRHYQRTALGVRRTGPNGVRPLPGLIWTATGNMGTCADVYGSGHSIWQTFQRRPSTLRPASSVPLNGVIPN